MTVSANEEMRTVASKNAKGGFDIGEEGVGIGLGLGLQGANDVAGQPTNRLRAGGLRSPAERAVGSMPIAGSALA